MFISDLSVILSNVKHLFYADDLKIYYKIKNATDINFLQNKLNDLFNWCNLNNLKLNLEKCYVISFSRKKSILYNNYTIKDVKIERVEKILDLGILLDHKMSFEAHYDMIVSRASKTLGFIKRRAKEFQNVWVTKTLYCTYVRSVLEYGCTIWMPYEDKFIKYIESVQKQFFYLLFDPNDFNNLPSYAHRLRIINLDSLKDRRDMLSSCFIFDVLKNNIDNESLSNRIFKNNNRQSNRSNADTRFLFEPAHSTLYGYNEPITRGIRLFNKFLNCYEDNSNFTKHTFKNRIKLTFK